MRPTGGHINDLLRPMGWTPDSLEARLFIENEYVKDAILECSVPRPSQLVMVRAIPMGGGDGGDQGTDRGRMVAMIGIMVAAIATQRYWVAGLPGV